MSQHEIVIVGGARTPMAEYVGAFKDVSAIELGARAASGALERAGAQPGWVDHVVMGKALHQALGEKAGIKRFGFASAPLDETLAQVTVDLSGRPYLVYNVNLPDRKIKAFDLGLFEDFFQAFVTHGGLNIHVNLMYGRNPHHIMEAIFKALAKALDQATMLEERLAGKVLSTKGML